MLGYSDSSKDSGLAASRWALHTAQEDLVAAVSANAKRSAINLTLFHSRGGGQPRDGIMATPAGTLTDRLRVTEQGEIIFQKYGVVYSARYSLENTLGAVLERTALEGADTALPAEWHDAAELIASHSRRHHRDTVYGDPRLGAYFRLATPIDIIERLRIGSRPPARHGGQGIENLRAIAWVFAWNQSRLIFTGWFGLSEELMPSSISMAWLNCARWLLAGFFSATNSPTLKWCSRKQTCASRLATPALPAISARKCSR
jgi:phosphoenolpyruvate carboxylase